MLQQSDFPIGTIVKHTVKQERTARPDGKVYKKEHTHIARVVAHTDTRVQLQFINGFKKYAKLSSIEIYDANSNIKQ